MSWLAWKIHNQYVNYNGLWAMGVLSLSTWLVLWLECSRMTRSIPWLLMLWLLRSPGHQQPWYWLFRVNRSLSFMGKDFTYLCYWSVGKWYKMQIFFNDSKINSASLELSLGVLKGFEQILICMSILIILWDWHMAGWSDDLKEGKNISISCH